MRYLGIDHGARKVGVSLSDESGTMGFPHEVLPHDARLLETILKLIEERGVGGVVIGDSRDFAGNPNPIATSAREFADKLTKRGITVYFEPEMLTTQEARRLPDGERDMTTLVDASAAALILTSFLDKKSKMETKTIEEKPTISLEYLKKIEIRIGTIVTAERVPDTDKLLRLTVDLGEETHRQIVSGINAYVQTPEELVSKQLAFVANLEPRTIRGLESNGMLFAIGEGETFAFLVPHTPVPPGTSAR